MNQALYGSTGTWLLPKPYSWKSWQAILAGVWLVVNGH